jgi:hypothetical protein
MKISMKTKIMNIERSALGCSMAEVAQGTVREFLSSHSRITVTQEVGGTPDKTQSPWEFRESLRDVFYHSKSPKKL